MCKYCTSLLACRLEQQLYRLLCIYQHVHISAYGVLTLHRCIDVVHARINIVAWPSSHRATFKASMKL